MKTTTNYSFKKPERNDPYNIEDFNESFDSIDTTLKAVAVQVASVSAHPADKSNPHSVTKSQVGLGNVPNVSTNDQTPTYTFASENAALSSGEKLSVAFGKIAKAVSSLISHLSNVSNPHSVTKSQVGLGSVPNVATNDQTPTYTVASENAILTSGEKLSVAFGKIAKAIASLFSHLADTTAHVTSTERSTWNGKANGSHTHTKSQITDFPTSMPASDVASWAKATTKPSYTKDEVGLGNVPNVATNNQTPTYTAASANAALTSGETLAVAFGKIAKAISSLITHLADTTVHITSTERTNWNDANSKKHTHSNKTTLDSITAAYTTAEQTKLSGIAAGAQVNSITGVKGNSETTYRTGNVNLTAANIGAAASSHNQAASTITAGTLAGAVKANATAAATLSTYQVRDIAAGTTDLIAGTSTLATGAIYIVYE